MTKRVILIAAGRGSRLEHYTDERPKCMVQLGGRSILEYQLEAFRKNEISDFHVIRGYLSEKLVLPGATYYENPEWERNNILHSLFCARPALVGSLLTTYSDIVFTPGVVKKALSMPGDINLIVDRQWARTYEGRRDHPVEQAELTEVDESLQVLRVGKHVGPERALGEFIGLASYSPRGIQIMCDVFDRLQRRLGEDDLFREGRIFRKAYLADLFEEIIAAGHPIHAIPIDGGWREIDTVEDLHSATELLSGEGATL